MIPNAQLLPAKGAAVLNLKRLVPEPVRRWRQLLSLLSNAERSALLTVVSGAMLQPRSRDWRPAVRGARSVIFVCHGNIIRSPLAAAALTREATARGRAVSVTSAGLAARPGEPADPRAIVSAESRGLTLEAHSARRLDPQQIETADVIFVMDHINLGRILASFPGARDRVFLLGGCQPGGRMILKEIQDPVSGTLADVGLAYDKVIVAVRCVAAAWDDAGS